MINKQSMLNKLKDEINEMEEFKVNFISNKKRTLKLNQKVIILNKGIKRTTNERNK
jgi:copper(I)-binding protein